MSWLTDVVRPKLRELVGAGRESPETLWHKCPSCGHMIFHRDVEKVLRVCPSCDHHMPLPANERLAMLFDDGTCAPIELPRPPPDPLRFRDARRYTDRLKDAQARTGLPEAVVVAHGRIGGEDSVVAVFDLAFLGGSMGTAAGEALLAAARLAIVQDAPLVVVAASAGVRIQEGALALMQAARTAIAVSELRETGLPYIVVLADPTLGVATASFAALGDIVIAEPGAVITAADSVALDEPGVSVGGGDTHTAEGLMARGVIDMIAHRHRLRQTLAGIIHLLRHRRPAAEILPLPARTCEPADPSAAVPSPPPPANQDAAPEGSPGAQPADTAEQEQAP